METLQAALNLKFELSIPRSICHRQKVSWRHSQSAPSSSFVYNQQQHEHPIFLHPPANQSVAAILLGHGPETQLWPLTKRRSAAAIPIAANYRLIDAVVSNCINSNITKIYALTQFNSTSLNCHLSRAYSKAGLGKNGFVEVIAAYQSPENQGWFQGNADAVRQCLCVLEEHQVMEFLILPGHHLYKMDYQKLIQYHRKSKADITISALSSAKNQDKGFGTLQLNSDNQVLELRKDLEIKPVHTVGISEDSKGFGWPKFVSMGIYVINKDIMSKILRQYFPGANDFRSEVIPGAILLGMKDQVQAYIHDGYWEDMGSIKAFYEANMASTKNTSMGYSFYDAESPVYTLPRTLPPAKVTDAVITDSVIGEGCILEGCRIKGTVVGLRSRIGDGAVIEDSVVLGSDFFYQEDLQHSGTKEKQMSIPIGIGEGCLIRNAIVDKNARIGKKVVITNKDNVQEGNREADGYVISGGIVVVIKSAIIPDGSII